MKRRQLLMALGMTMLVTGSLSSPHAARADALSDIASRGTIRVAVPQDFPPFGSVGTDMAPMGYDIDMANLIGEKLGVKTELVPVTSANRIPYLQTNKVDLVISSLGKNAERQAVIDFTDAYAPFFNGVFGPADVTAAKPEDLSGKTIGVTRGAIEDLALTKVAPKTRRSSATKTITAPFPPSCRVRLTWSPPATSLPRRSSPGTRRRSRR